jgi:hypothetical protein
MNKRIVVALIELATAGLAVWSMNRGDMNTIATAWHALMRSCQVAALRLGQLGMYAEVKYREVVAA